MNITNTGGAPTILIDAKTADEYTSVPFQNLGSHKDAVVTFTSNGTTSGGNLIIEESDLPSYTGTWSNIRTQAASDFTGGAKKCVHISLGAGLWTRVRISDAITGGGSVTVSISGA